jgi:hypothetical protein
MSDFRFIQKDGQSIDPDAIRERFFGTARTMLARGGIKAGVCQRVGQMPSVKLYFHAAYSTARFLASDPLKIFTSTPPSLS